MRTGNQADGVGDFKRRNEDQAIIMRVDRRREILGTPQETDQNFRLRGTCRVASFPGGRS